MLNCFIFSLEQPVPNLETEMVLLCYEFMIFFLFLARPGWGVVWALCALVGVIEKYYIRDRSLYFLMFYFQKAGGTGC